MIRPGNEVELAEAIQSASTHFAIQGGNTRGSDAEGAVLSTAGLSGITLYEPGALTMVAQAGTPLSDIEAALNKEGQRLAFEPLDMRGLFRGEGVSTIGGVFATNSSGPRRVAVGAARDFLLGVRFVDGLGRIVKNGGRVMKNVTGYDLVKLMAGSWGTLGVMSEVSFKVLPKPETQGTVCISGQSVEEAVSAMALALASPFEVTGATHMPETSRGISETVFRVEGNALSVSYRISRLEDLLRGLGQVSSYESDDQRWQSLRDLSCWAGSDNDIWRISVKPSDAPMIVARLPENTKVMLDWGGGLIWATMPQGTDLRAVLGVFSGHATRMRGLGGSPKFQPEPALIAALSKALRQKFDPKSIFNRGLTEQSC